MSDALRDIMRRHIEEFLDGSGAGALATTVARDHEALPILIRPEKVLALRCDGDAVLFTAEGDDVKVHPLSAYGRHLVLFRAAARPGLEMLRPERPGDAIDCPRCGGAGDPPPGGG